jgi:DNA-binding PadR family transcriptional regulator
MGRNASPLTYNELLVLQALSLGHRYGFELMSVTGLSAGTVYPLLRRLDARGYVEASREDERAAHAEGRPARRMHEITPDGLAALAAARRELIARHEALGLRPQGH